MVDEESDDEILQFLERSSCLPEESSYDEVVNDQNIDRISYLDCNFGEFPTFPDVHEGSKRNCNDPRPSKRHCSGLTLIERPLTFDSSLDFANESRSKILLKQMDWYFPILDRYLEAGYLADALVRVFRSIPRDLEDAIKQGLRALQIIKSSSEAAQLRGPSPSSHSPSPVAEDLAALPNTEDMMWEARADCGYLRLEWDPVTQRRRRAVINTAFAAINGMHPEEAVARIANREAALGRTNEVDPFRAPLHRITLHPDRWSVLALRQLARHARLIFLLSSLRTPLLL